MAVSTTGSTITFSDDEEGLRRGKPKYFNRQSPRTFSIQMSQSSPGSTSVTKSDRTLSSEPRSLGPIPRYRWTCAYRYPAVRSKGAVLVLVWNFLVFNCISSVYSIVLKGIIDHLGFVPSDYAWTLTVSSLMRVFVWIFYPIAGWLSDTYIGRYRTVSYSMFIIWMGSIAMTGCVAVLYSYPSHTKLAHFVNLGAFSVIYVIMCIGMAGFQANVVQFGTDQMQGASSDQLSSFILWYLWTEYFGFGVIYSYLLSCEMKEQELLLSQAFVVTCCMSGALCLNFLFRDTLEIQPAQGNPFKNIFKVLKFVKKYKTPPYRSALTYWEDGIPSRLDVAKQRYGGPYTTEQVEDVKTFFRIVAVIVSLICFWACYVVLSTSGQLSNHLRGGRSRTSLSCYLDAGIDNIQIHVICFGVPLYHFLVQPFIQNVVPTTLRRIALGVVFGISSVTSTLVIEVIGYKTAGEEAHVCWLTTPGSDSTELNIDNRWLIIPNTLLGLSYLTIGSSITEFICAQSPYSLKGIMIGLSFSAYGISNAIGFLILLAFYLSFNSRNDDAPHVPQGCGFWYYIVNVILVVVGGLIYVCVAKWYKRRKRDDLSFQPIYVEEYYSHQPT